MEVKTEGIVIKSVGYKENDKILTVLTPSGKLTVGAKGVRKATAKLAFSAQPFSFCEYVLHQSADRYTLTGAFLHDGFYELRLDLLKYYSASAMAELSDAMCLSDGDVKELFIALAEGLKTLSMTDHDAGETLLTFCLVALTEGGYMLDLDGCGKCHGDVKGTGFFDFSKGYFLCKNCGGKVRASEETYEALRLAAGLEADEEKAKNGRCRALRLIKAYLTKKTDSEYPCLSEFIKLYQGEKND